MSFGIHHNPNERCGSLIKTMNEVGGWLQDKMPYLLGRSVCASSAPRPTPPPLHIRISDSGPFLGPPPMEPPPPLLQVELKFFQVLIENNQLNKEDVSALRRTCRRFVQLFKEDVQFWSLLYNRDIPFPIPPLWRFQKGYHFHSNLARGNFSLKGVRLDKFIPAAIIDGIAISASTRFLRCIDLSSGMRSHYEGEIKGIIAALFIKNVWIVGTIDGKIRMWNIRKGQMLSLTPSHPVRAFAVAEDTLFSGGESAIELWNMKNGKRLRTLKDGQVRCLAVTKDLLISGSNDFKIKVRDLNNLKKAPLVLQEHQGGVGCLAVENDLLFSGSDDFTIKVWDLSTREYLCTLKGHTGWVTCLLLHDGVLFSGSTDQTIRAWNPKTGECLTTLTGHGEKIWSLSFQGDNLLSLGGWDHRILQWDFKAAQNTILQEISLVLRSNPSQKALDRALSRFSNLSKSAKQGIYAKLAGQEKFQSATPNEKAQAIEAYLLATKAPA